MEKIAIVTDSNSGITPQEAKELGLFVLPMPFTINDTEYREGIDLLPADFYDHLRAGDNIYTSQPSLPSVQELWNSLLNQGYDKIVHLPTSKGLSGSYEMACVLAEEFHHQVYVVDTKRISVILRQMALDALELKEAGKSAEEMKTLLEANAGMSSVYIMVDTLKYLKKGGRITAAAAALGTILQLKPVLQIQGDKLDAFAKARNVRHAKKIMLDALAKDIREKYLAEGKMDQVHLSIGHADAYEAACAFKEELLALYPDSEIYIGQVSLSVATHIGPGCFAIASSRKQPLE